MSKADEMFEELGYVKVSEFNYIRNIDLENKVRHIYVEFDCLFKRVEVFRIVIGKRRSVQVRYTHHLAIHQKMKELGWLSNE